MLCFSPRGQGDVVTEDPTRTGMWSPQNGNTEEFHIWAMKKKAPGCSGDEMPPTLLEEFRKKNGLFHFRFVRYLENVKK